MLHATIFHVACYMLQYQTCLIFYDVACYKLLSNFFGMYVRMCNGVRIRILFGKASKQEINYVAKRILQNRT